MSGSNAYRNTDVRPGGINRVAAPEDLKIQSFSRPFHSTIQGQFKAFFQSIIL